MSIPRGVQRFAATARSPAAATLGYWYGLSGACATILLELYRHPKGCRVPELLDLLETNAEPHIIAVYICYLRQCLKRSFEDEDMIEVVRGEIPKGPHASALLTRYRLKPAAFADIRECLEMAHEELSAILGDKAVRVAA